jgi:hypothetical protein
MSSLQQALADKPHVWGGRINGPTFIGPEEFACAVSIALDAFIAGQPAAAVLFHGR